MIHVLWIIWVGIFTPPILIVMGGVAIQRIRNSWRTMNWLWRIVFSIDSIMLPLGILTLILSIWEAVS